MSTPAQITESDAFEKDQPFTSSTASNARLVEVIAPSTLEQGYTFDAIHDGQVFPVTVPPGGVKAGESFSVPFLPSTTRYSDDTIFYAEAIPIANEVAPLVSPRHNTTDALTSAAPLGRWKDGLCDCCAAGCCHPSCCNAIYCRQILMGQVLTRMQMTWCGNPSKSRSQSKNTFHILLWLTFGYWIISIIFHCDRDHNGHCDGFPYGFLGTVRIVWFLYTVVVMTKLRKAVRDRYRIPQTQCMCFEDCCCAVFCSCCTMAQLARQTADYERQRAYCCTDTGLAEEKYTLEESLIV
ncbi:PLAC8 family domain containing protein [Nitzschia inconspicua]|uniref:PLAC8 family domain containing protein n=1 Tax=Nitzschia inconspicua TaxID=303405 RepID=A0A9K3LG51_9STRA|nr:PLAC8 family domain containing protein [Nitzschia inconspicua]KAG7361215.1 PLAC8 family domain containing protein [Nitzschia inconspicua]